MKTKFLALIGSAVVVAPLSLGAAGSAANAVTDENPPILVKDGITQPLYDYSDAIRETVWVDAPDLDGDGRRERVAADIVRPRELDGTAKVPVIMDASPYYLSSGRGNEAEHKEYGADGTVDMMPLYYDNYFVPRGYAFVAVDMAGTARSTGCVDEGALSDIESVKAVVEWLNGNAAGYDASGDVVDADWTNGKTGMIGKSYDGTLANGVAATGVEGLKTIVPISAISSWYDYNRWQGAVKSNNYASYLSRAVAGNRTIPTDCNAQLTWMNENDGDETGQYTDFWADRDYRSGSLYDARNVTASVFVVHGLQDNNVKTMNASKWWADLAQTGVKRKMWLTRLGHVDPFDSERALWVKTLNRWFDSELMDVQNGIDREPAVSVEVGPNQWEQSKTWPIASARTMDLRLHGDGTMMLGKAESGTASYINTGRVSESAAVAATANPNRLLWVTGTTKHEIRISGTPTVDLAVNHSAPVGQVSVMLVDYGTMDRVSASGDGAMTLNTESCWGAATATDDACYRDVAKRVQSSNLQILARGWVRLDGAGDHTATVELAANDVVVPAGHHLGLVITGSNNGVIMPDTARNPYTVDLAQTTLHLPVSGPMSGFGPGALNIASTENLVDGTLPTAQDLFRGLED
ncbi:CocE/NonD family hydrolase [Microbacterium terrisoli]|uniref:CocE/NonD family hydrolase n=1 Tax=Microbacterium terrisoli TaxID=3242192 RepID=UPI0028059BE5|nr:CocE/NonD family hydrolase [Microbacterium protaetiae]